jgi:uncharacterized protein with HEPN domain
MQRDSRAYLADILEACDAIEAATSDRSLGDYMSNRLIRSAVERELTIIGEAVLALSHKAPEVFDAITGAREAGHAASPPRVRGAARAVGVVEA